MKKSILTTLFLVPAAMGLMAQSKKADTAKKAKAESTAEGYTLTHQDSAMMERAIINYKAQPLEDILPFHSSGLPGTGINDVIDVEHEIK